MQNRQAARYARWSAGAAIIIVLVVAAVFLHGRLANRAARKNLPPAVPPSVQQQSADFTFSKQLKNHTLFTLHASQATEFKDKNRSLLENVSITIYGPEGKRNDSVRANECSYVPDTGSIRCQGTVQIDLRNAAKNPAANLGSGGMHFETSDILFDRDSGKVSTKNNVTLRFPGGEGQATGVFYDPQTEDARLQSNVQLTMTPPANSRALPANVTGRALEFRRSDGTLRLFGPVRAKQGQRILSASAVEIDLDAQMHPRLVIASGHPEIIAEDPRGNASLVANQMDASFADGAIEKISADGNVRGNAHSRGGENLISAEHVDLMMAAAKDGASQPRQMLARGNVQVAMQHGSAKRNLRTAALRIDFVPEVGRRGVRVANAETLSAGEVVTSKPGESDTISGGKLIADFDAQSQLTQLRGASGVRVVHQSGSVAPQITTAQNLTAGFGAGGDWEAVEEDGGVKFQQAGRTGQANQARMLRSANQITLTGAASVADSTSRSSAEQIEINQKTGEVHAAGNVITTYFGNTKKPGASEANISADQMNGSSATDHAVFSGRARFWQGADVLQADTIEFWRQQNRAEARGNVVGAFPELPPSTPNAKSKAGMATVWQVRAPKADYDGNAGKGDAAVKLTDGVTAQSARGSISSQTLTLFLSAPNNRQQKLERAVAEGNVRIEQNGRIGTSERGEYIASDGKFVLSGGKPALSDGSGNTTTGRELTFFLASDTILVDSQKGPRTITKHRVEK
ncbi:MAG TPA: LPS export ABC transporter periplasmic protein LptC [Candidatus Acidoferrales bacterium]|nr:LPS export ABC transporter periplasmic protein LptC [Candidatus Acidoferrales bacterium]